MGLGPPVIYPGPFQKKVPGDLLDMRRSVWAEYPPPPHSLSVHLAPCPSFALLCLFFDLRLMES